MKTLEYHLPCINIRDHVAYGYYIPKKHDRNDMTYDFIINGTKYIFHICQNCYKLQSSINVYDYGYYAILMNYIFNDCNVFGMEMYDRADGIARSNPMEWCRHRDYQWKREYENDENWIKIDNDSYNSFYLNRNCL